VKLFEGKIFDVERREGLEVVVHGPAVAIVAVDRERHVTLVRQPRPAAGGPLLELPAGGVEPGESPLECARRELREETGLHGGEWEEVAAVFTTPGFCDEKIHLFVATGLEQGEAAPEGSEEIEVVRVPVAELGALLPDLEDAKTLAGLLLLERRL
jgi:ADP-ribose pyrophosphatase